MMTKHLYIHTENIDVRIHALTTKTNLRWYERPYITEKCVKMSKWIKWTYANERWECPNVKSERTDNPPKWRMDQKAVQHTHRRPFEPSAYFSSEWNKRKNVLRTKNKEQRNEEEERKGGGGRLSVHFPSPGLRNLRVLPLPPWFYSFHTWFYNDLRSLFTFSPEFAFKALGTGISLVSSSSF